MMHSVARPASPISTLRFAGPAAKADPSAAAAAAAPQKSKAKVKADEVPPTPAQIMNGLQATKKLRKFASTLAICGMMLTGATAGHQQTEKLADFIHGKEHEGIYESPEKRAIIPVAPEKRMDDKKLAAQVQQVFFPSTDNLMLHGWYLPAKDPKKGTVIYIHGRAGRISDQGNVNLMQSFAKLGYGFFMYDPRGYGGNPGDPDEEGFYSDLKSASQYVAERYSIPVDQQILMGHSLGGAQVNHTAAEIEQSAGTALKGVAIISSFTTMKDEMYFQNQVNAAKYDINPDGHNWKDISWSLTQKVLKNPTLGKAILDFMTTQDYRAIDGIGKIQAPIYIYHGDKDTVIPTEMGSQLCQTATTAHKDFTVVPGKDHSGILGDIKSTDKIADSFDQKLHHPPKTNHCEMPQKK
jgi:alpha-beta hydrolase superfamily lysophospholipase